MPGPISVPLVKRKEKNPQNKTDLNSSDHSLGFSARLFPEGFFSSFMRSTLSRKEKKSSFLLEKKKRCEIVVSISEAF